MKKTYLTGKTACLVMAATVCISNLLGGTTKTVQAGNNPRSITAEYVSFGNYWQEDTNNDGVANELDDKTPIVWRVLWSSNSQALLLSEKCLDARAFHDTTEKVTWETCDLRKWLNDTFISTAFNQKEQAAILEKEIITDGDPFTETTQDIITKDNIFLPSVAEMTNVNYNYGCSGTVTDSARTTTNTTYCAAKTDRNSPGENDTYWLRNSGQSNDEACAVTIHGQIEYLNPVDYQGHGIRPALYLDLSAENTWTEADTPDKPSIPVQTPKPIRTTTPSLPPEENFDTETISNNLHQNEYPLYAAQTVNSYLTPISESLYERAEYTGNKIIIETYDKNEFHQQSGIELPMELPLFGGIYSGSKYNFIVYGQENPEENDSKEIIRICKYDKNWNRLGAGSIYGANTIVPFLSGSLRMCESKDMLYIRTCHKMYASHKDGLNHQANMSIALRQSDTTVTDCFSSVMNINYSGYVSHSFNQFIKTDGNSLITADHGDAYPRAFVLVRFPGIAGGENITTKTEAIELNHFTGNIGENYTGAELGGLEVSDSHYLTVCSSTDQETNYMGKVRNIYLYAVNKSSFTSDSINVQQITHYAANGSVTASVPNIIKTGENRFVLLWEEFVPHASTAFYPGIDCTKTLKYVLIDGQANLPGDIQSVSGCLSDCMPVAENGNLTWYVTENGTLTFYRLNPEKGTIETHTTKKETTEPTDTPTTTPGEEPTTAPSNPPSELPPATNETEFIKAPGKVTIKTLKTSGKGCAKVTWKKVTCTDGYQIQYSTKQNFSDKKKTTSYSKSTYIYGKSKKTYYVRVRAVNWGRISQTKYDYKYGKWSKTKKIKLK